METIGNPLYIVEARRVFNDANVSDWNYWGCFNFFDEAINAIEYDCGMVQEVGWQGGLYEPLEDNRVQYRVVKKITTINQNGFDTYYDSIESEYELDRDRYDLYAKEMAAKKALHVFFDRMLVVAEEIADKHLRQCS